MPFINIKLIWFWPGLKLRIVSTNNANQAATFTIADVKTYVPVETL